MAGESNAIVQSEIRRLIKAHPDNLATTLLLAFEKVLNDKGTLSMNAQLAIQGMRLAELFENYRTAELQFQTGTIGYEIESQWQENRDRVEELAKRVLDFLKAIEKPEAEHLTLKKRIESLLNQR